jgi:hypothetical protein
MQAQFWITTIANFQATKIGMPDWRLDAQISNSSTMWAIRIP